MKRMRTFIKTALLGGMAKQSKLDFLKQGDAKTIIRVSKKAKADLIVLGTHGKTGTDAFWSGSVTPGVCAGCDVPILHVPVKL